MSTFIIAGQEFAPGKYAKINGQAHWILTENGEVTYVDRRGDVHIVSEKTISKRIDEGFVHKLGTKNSAGKGSASTVFVAKAVKFETVDMDSAGMTEIEDGESFTAAELAAKLG
jgi:hypothetical protein